MGKCLNQRRKLGEGEEGVIAKPVLDTNACLVNMIHEYLQKERDNICIFENFEAKKSDPFPGSDEFVAD